MKKFYCKLTSLKPFAMGVVLFLALSLSADAVFSQIILPDELSLMLDPSGGHEEVWDYGSGVKEFRWRLSNDLFNWGVWAHDIWTPYGSYGNMVQSELRKVGNLPWVYSDLTLTTTMGYGTLYPGTHIVYVACEETSVDSFLGTVNVFNHGKPHTYVVQ